MAPRLRHVEAALTLRRFTIAALTGRSSGPEAGALATSPAAWALFLDVDQCAGALSAACARVGIKPAGGPLLSDRVRDDTQRALSSRGHLATIAAIARENLWPVVVLKGATAAAAGQPIHLADVDVLVREEHALEWAAALSRRLGITMEGHPSPRHLAPIGTPNALPVEIHTSIDNRWTSLTKRAWERIMPLDNFPGLSRLAPPDHALHMLTHVVIDHPYRRGRIRDSLLIGSAVAECDVAARTELATRIAGPYRHHLTTQLVFAEALATGTPTSDPFEMIAFTHLWLVEREKARRPPRSPIWKELYPTVWLWVIGQTAGWSSRQRILDGLHEPPAAPSSLRVTAWLEHRFPGLGRGLRLSLRATQYLLTYVLAWPIARSIRSDAKRAGVTS